MMIRDHDPLDRRPPGAEVDAWSSDELDVYVEPVSPSQASKEVRLEALPHRAAWAAVQAWVWVVAVGAMGAAAVLHGEGAITLSEAWQRRLAYASFPLLWWGLHLCSALRGCAPARGGWLVAPMAALAIGGVASHGAFHRALGEDPWVALTAFTDALVAGGHGPRFVRLYAIHTQVVTLALVIGGWSALLRHAPAVVASVARRRGGPLRAYLKAALGREAPAGQRRARLYHALWWVVCAAPVFLGLQNLHVSLVHAGHHGPLAPGALVVIIGGCVLPFPLWLSWATRRWRRRRDEASAQAGASAQPGA